MTTKAILFDLDGVLVDSLSSWHRAFNESMKKFGYGEFNKKEFEEKFWGPQLEKNLEKMRMGNEAVRYCISKHLEFIDEIKLFPMVREVLARLSQEFKIGLITNTPKENVYKILKKFDLKKYFHTIVTGDEVINGKPDPEMVVKACNLLDVEPKDAVLVGDTGSDVIAGRSAGCIIIGINANANADFKIEQLSQLLEFKEALLSK